MGIFIPMDSYMLILEEVGRWKIVGMQKLFQTLNLNFSYSFFCRQVKKLEAEGLLRSITGMKKRKYLTLTDSGGTFVPFNAQFEGSDAELNHDLIVSNVIHELNKFETLGEGHVLQESDFFSVMPDGIIYINKKDIHASLAIEVELTQKSKQRITKKFTDYKRASCFNYCLYIFNKKSAYSAYKRQLEQMNESIRNKILLLLDEKLSISQFSYEDNNCFFKGEEKPFKDIFLNASNN